MATLIQSKQIQGVVTASVVEGEFKVSGSFIATGSNSIFGNITASAISSSGPIYGVRYTDIQGTPSFIGGTGITIEEVGGTYTIINSATDDSGSDSQTLSIVGDQLTISSGNTITIPTGSGGGASSWDELSGIPSGIISGSEQLPQGLISGSTFSTFSSSVDSRITGISAGGAGADWSTNLQNIPSGIVSGSQQVIILLPEGVISGSEQLPSGIVSSSAQITSLGFISESFSTDNTDIVSGSVLRTLDGTGVLSGSIIDQLPSGVVSGSSQITDGSDIVSGSVLRTLDGTDVVSGSVLRTLDGTDVVSGSVLRTLDGTDVISGSLVGGTNVTITSGSGIITISASDVSGSDASLIDSLNTFTSSIQTEVDAISAQTSSYLTELPSGLVSGSFSSSIDSRIDTEKTRIDNILSGANSDYDQFVEIVNLVNSTDTTNDTAFANHYTSSRQRLTALETFTSSIDSTIKSKLDSDGVFSGSIVAGENITINVDGSNYIISSSASGGSSNVTVSDSAPNSPSEGDLWWKSDDGNLYVYYDGYWVISVDTTNALPTGVISGSAQITALGFVSSSGDNTPEGTISGSAQITALGFISESFSTDGTGIVSGSVLRTLDGTDVVSGSVLRTLDGTGVLSGSKTDISSLNTFSSSIQTEVDGLSAATSSYLTELPSGVVSGSSQLTSSYDTRYALSGSGGGGDVSFDGDRIISQDKLPEFFSASFNPGTTGSVQDFLNAVFYPNSAPSITTGNQTIAEYTPSSTTIVTIAGTDPEGQSLTFGTASSYTDDLVRVASNGVLTLNALAESSSFNTDLVGGVHGHTFTATATDTFNSTVEKDITVFVTPNSTPVFRETSTSGNIITSVTSNLNESSADDTLVKRVYFTDANGDTITIHSSSVDNNHFDITKYSTYVDIRQNTGSLDYESQTTYTFSISASDEHYEAGQDSDSIATLPITVNVVDNATPTVNNQTLSSINENSSNGATVGTISAADSEGDTITFKNFELHQILLDGSNVSSGSYGGSSQLTDPHENPFQMSSSGVVTRKTGVYLNSDLINRYIYRVQVTDSYNTDSAVGLVTINIDDDTPATITDNWSAGPYIIESAVTNNAIRVNSNGRTGTQADYGSNQSGTWSSSKPAISINSNGSLSIGLDISGSSTGSGDTIDSVITFTNTFGTTTTDNLSVSVTTNEAPTINTTSTSNLNTNQATGSAQILVLGINDTEGDSIPNSALSFEGYNTTYFTPTINSSLMYLLVNNTSVPAGTYAYTASLQDVHGFRTNKESGSFTIAQADNGTLGGDTTSYIIESGQSGDSIRDASGFGAGNASQVSVSYSTSYGSPVVQSFTSSNEAIAIDNSGNLTLGLNISGSTTGSGDTITSTITFVDQYGNQDTGTVTVNVFDNHHPSASFTDVTGDLNTNEATTGTDLVNVTITDTEGDTPYSASLSGTDASSFQLQYNNSNSSSLDIQAASNLSAQTYNYTLNVFDNFGKSSSYDRTLTISQADIGTLGTNGTFYVIESAVNGNNIVTNSNGRTGTQGDLSVSYSPNYGSQVVQSFTSSNALIDVNSSGNLSVGTNISGSGQLSGDTISSNITFVDQYGNIGSGSISVNVTTNNAPDITFSNSSFLNTNQASGSSGTLVTLTFSDTEGDTIDYDGVTFSDSSNQLTFTQNSNTWLVTANSQLSASNYTFSASVDDVHSFRTNTEGHTITIVQSGLGTLGGDTSIYSIESAESGDAYRDATGYNNGNTAQVSVSYSPSYGSQVVQSFTSSNQAIAIDNSGNLTLGLDLSGSVTQSGDTINSTITYVDQYGNIGSGSVTATLFGNASPAASFVSSSNYESDNATSGSNAGTLTITDTESNSPFTVTLAGTDGGKFDASGSAGSFQIQPTGSLDAGTYTINITVTDSYSESVTLTNETITVDQSANNGEIYIYYSNYGTVSGFNSNYNAVMGASTVNSDTPPQVTAYTANTASPYYKFKSGDIGSTTISLAGSKTATLAATVSGSDLNTAISESAGAMSWTNGVQTIIVFPSGSSMTGVPTSMADAFGGSTDGEYVLVEYVDGTSAPLGAASTVIQSIVLDSAKDGFTEWNVIGTVGQNSGTTMRLKILPSSGSLGDF